MDAAHTALGPLGCFGRLLRRPVPRRRFPALLGLFGPVGLPLVSSETPVQGIHQHVDGGEGGGSPLFSVQDGGAANPYRHLRHHPVVLGPGALRVNLHSNEVDAGKVPVKALDFPGDVRAEAFVDVEVAALDLQQRI